MAANERLESIEEKMASTEILCSDKTGTLTQNESDAHRYSAMEGKPPRPKAASCDKNHNIILYISLRKMAGSIACSFQSASHPHQFWLPSFFCLEHCV
jgi:P-type E1-E2 ATPase